jgi:hypothetical protein
MTSIIRTKQTVNRLPILTRCTRSLSSRFPPGLFDSDVTGSYGRPAWKPVICMSSFSRAAAASGALEVPAKTECTARA